MKHRKVKTIIASAALAAACTITSFAGFVETPQGVKYQWGDGSYCVNNRVHYRDHRFYFGNDELMRTGRIQRDNTWYYAADTGELQAGIMQINGNVYYFDKTNCKMVTGDRWYDFRSYHFTENGVTGDRPYVNDSRDSNGNLLRGSKQSVR